MLSDPQSVTVNAVAISLPKTSNGPTQNIYTSADQNTTMTVKQNVSTSRFRREVRLANQKVAVDALSGVSRLQGLSVYLVIDEPKGSPFTDAEIKYHIEALKTWLTSGNQDKILGGEF